MSEVSDIPGFDRRMTRDEINELPIRRYTGRIKLVRDQRDVKAVVRHLSQEAILGFDTESRPTFVKGENHPVALLQLAGRHTVYVIQLKLTGLTGDLRKLLASQKIIKAGVAWDQDVAKLKELADFRPAGFIDLAKSAREEEIKNHGLRGLAAVLLGFRISKQAQRSNWARHDLSRAQIVYAATDAWVSREIYLKLKDGR